MSKLYHIGDFSGQVTGQSLVMSKVAENLGGIRINNTVRFFLYPSYWLKVVLIRNSKIYFTPSRRDITFLLRDLPILAFSRLNNNSVTAHFHGNDVDCWLDSSISKKFILRLYAKVNAIIILDQTLVPKSFFRFTNLNILPNVSFRQPCNCEKKRDDILFLSNLFGEKGERFILDLARSMPTESFLIAGRFLQEKYEKTFMRLLNDVPNVSYFGPLTDSNQCEFWCQGRIFLFPSSYKTEAYPLVLLEAKQNNCFVLSADVGATKNMLTERDAILPLDTLLWRDEIWKRKDKVPKEPENIVNPEAFFLSIREILCYYQ